MIDEISFSFTRQIPAVALHDLCQQTEWANERRPEDIIVVLRNSSLCLGAWRGEQLVGFARVLTDDRYRAFVEDIIVTQDVRGQGVGFGLIDHVMQRLEHVEEIMLVCEEALVPFYEQHGFEPVDYPTTMKRRLPAAS